MACPAATAAPGAVISRRAVGDGCVSRVGGVCAWYRLGLSVFIIHGIARLNGNSPLHYGYYWWQPTKW